MCAGLVMAANHYRWPTSSEYLTQVLPAAIKTLTEVDLKGALIGRSLLRFFELAESRADDLSILLRDLWKIDLPIYKLPETPQWLINATCYETGKNWHFEKLRMGDYLFGYSANPNVPLSDAMAASSGFPGLIGALSLETGGRKWFNYVEESAATQVLGSAGAKKEKTKPVKPAYSPVHLWDGGVYDNHGLEGVHSFRYGWKKGIFRIARYSGW